MKLKNIYTSVACNRTPESADWGNNGLILFAACNSVSLFNPNVCICEIIQLLFSGQELITNPFSV